MVAQPPTRKQNGKQQTVELGPVAAQTRKDVITCFSPFCQWNTSCQIHNRQRERKRDNTHRDEHELLSHPSCQLQTLSLPTVTTQNWPSRDPSAAAFVWKKMAEANEKPGKNSRVCFPFNFLQMFDKWLCLKMLCTPKKNNGFADHYPYEKWLFHWGYTPFSDIPLSSCPPPHSCQLNGVNWRFIAQVESLKLTSRRHDLAVSQELDGRQRSLGNAPNIPNGIQYI